MSIINNGLLLASEAAAAGGYQVSRSLRFNSADSAYLSRTPGSAGNRRTFTLSFWYKRSNIATSVEQAIFTTNTTYDGIRFENNSDKLRFFLNGAASADILTTQVFRDPSAWYHFLIAVDTTQGTASNRIKIYANGTQITTFDTSTYPSQNYDCSFNSTNQHVFGFSPTAGTHYLNGYLADIHFIDGQALTPSSFAETNSVTGQWVPKAFSGGSYGTNGFRLSFSDNSGTTSTTLGKDSAGSNNWTPNNFSVASGSGNDSLVDTPTSYGTDTGAGGEVRGNYCTLNPLKYGGDIQAPTNGNLDVTSVGSATGKILGTIGVSSGKWYWECVPNSSANIAFGITKDNTVLANYPGQDAVDYAYHNDGLKYNNNSGSSYGASYTTNDVIGIAFDADNGTLTFYKNNSSQGQAYSGLTSGPYFPMVGDPSSTPDISATANFGQRPFAYTAPSGFKALVDTNLPAPVVAKPNTVMDVKLYTGNGGSQTISGYAFSPDLVWIKQRSGTTDHGLFDTVRGVYLQLRSNTTAGDNTVTNALTSFTSDGYVLGGDGPINGNGLTYVNWAWDAGSSAAATNNSGSIQSTVKVNATSGFSVVTWTGQTAAGSIGHGLNAAPSLIICKARSNAQSWGVYHKDVGINNYLLLDSTGASTAYSGIWGSSAPTSTVFSVPGNVGLNNNNGWTYVGYCFAPVVGYSSGFSYTGNGSTDGVFQFLGFRPRLILLKRTDTTGNWTLIDTAREGYNVDNDPLYPNLSDAEGTADLLDITSNGFKLRSTDASVNANAGTYVGFAWAETPFAYSRAR